ncbi:hypothetical protein D3C72_2465640 [compost metagenome]
MSEHWHSGLDDIRRSFGNSDWFAIPSHDLGFVTHDIHRHPLAANESDHRELADRDDAARIATPDSGIRVDA